jgi:hypothetical protein
MTSSVTPFPEPPRNWRPRKNPWEPGDGPLDEAVVASVRAFARGKASESQQKLVWDWLHYLAGVGDEWINLVYRPGSGGDRDTSFAAGMQWPIIQMRTLLRPEFNPKPKSPEQSIAEAAKAHRAEAVGRIRGRGRKTR